MTLKATHSILLHHLPHRLRGLPVVVRSERLLRIFLFQWTPEELTVSQVIASDSGADSDDEEPTLFESSSPCLIQKRPIPSTPPRSTKVRSNCVRLDVWMLLNIQYSSKRPYPCNGTSSDSDVQTPVKKCRVAARMPTPIPGAESSTDDDTPIVDLYTAKYLSSPTRAHLILATTDTDDDTPIVNIDRSKHQSTPRSLRRK